MYKNNKLSKAVRLAMAFGTVAAVAFPSHAIANVDEEEAAPVERIEVTGSRIRRLGEIAPTPVTVITGDSIVDSGVTNVADLLHRMPNTLIGLSPETSNNTIFASGLNNTDLRGLGSNRTLVLVNGRRFVSGAPGSSAVDLNNIPTAMIDRIEITTGGSSAVYGSDAVAGVVNIITKTSYDGVTLDVSTTQTRQSGGEEEYASLTFGADLGRASFISNLSWARQKQISFMDRDFLRNAPIVIRNPDLISGDPNSPLAVVWGYGEQVLASYTKSGTFSAGGTRYTFSDDGSLRPQQLGQPLPPLTSGRVDYLGGEGYNFAENSFMRTPLDRINFITNMSYEFNDDHRMQVEFNLSKTDAYGESSPAFLNLITQGDNALLPQDARDLISQQNVGATYPNGAVSMGYLASDFGNRQYSQDRTLARISIGFDGAINDNWMYNAYLTSGHVQADTEWYGEMYEDRFYDAVDAIELDGQVVCRDEIARAQGCLPLNIFGRGIYDADAYDWVSTDAIRRSSIQQHVAGVSVNGDIMELPAGWLAAAFAVEYRKEKAKTLPDPAMRAGLLFNNQSQPLDGEFDVKEISAEFSVPLFEGLPFMESLTFETAGRAMNYSTSGSDTAWKVGLNWEVNDELRIRINRSKSVRAPNITELFAPPGQTFAGITDLCATSQRDGLNPDYRENILNNCAAQGIPTDFEPSPEWFGSTRPGFIIGNTDLTNESAKDITIGFVYNPSFVDDLSITVDYWKFDMSNMIQSFTANNLVRYCYQSNSIDNVYCPLLERDPETFEIVNFFQKPINSALSTTAGVDIETNYRLSTDIGDFGIRWIGTYLAERTFNQTGFAEDEIVQTGEQARPRWRNRLISSYSYKDVSAVLTMTHRKNSVVNNQWTPNQNNYNDVPSYITWDLTGRYNVNDDLQVRAGILNMFDKAPPRLPNMYNNGNYYDMMGQRFTLGVNYTF
ncbi:TonB-dependent receptor [Alkalimonas collagenimarina]|uniref:TonB-dependent receptor n=1 Tax=Alkalimonas collagenimarina TaxID=400390 RepID=A0ABT9GV71_9GAMM|nr:TonB-dependent receptor [Alkalimonas collagenimarina]MDP4534948.1 TonB-dependent receptor [Alkalimonas collagenimarina]